MRLKQVIIRTTKAEGNRSISTRKILRLKKTKEFDYLVDTRR